MKKALLLVCILFVSVISTACINNFAVQELNSKAKLYLEEGDYNAAIERLKSSIDLDDSIFETHYNLAVAYTQAEDYANAIDAFKKAIDINPEFADSYYSLAVAQGNLAVDLYKGTVRINENGELYLPKEEDLSEDEYKPSESVLNMINHLKADAVNNYKIYLEKVPDSQDADDVKAKIEELEKSDNVVKD